MFLVTPLSLSELLIPLLILELIFRTSNVDRGPVVLQDVFQDGMVKVPSLVYRATVGFSVTWLLGFRCAANTLT